MKKLKHNKAIVMSPLSFYRQERDWTCAVACIRSILSGILDNVPTEEEFITNYKLKPNPYYSRDIKTYHLLDKYDVIYGCENKNCEFDDILDYLQEKYFLMIECMVNYSHWLVLLGYYPLVDGDIEDCRVLLYDPYYDTIRLMNTDELISMWVDGNYEKSRVKGDFIAIRKKLNEKY